MISIMKKLSILTAILLFASSSAFAQQQRMGTISGNVADDATAQPIPGAAIEIISGADSTLVKGEVSDTQSRFAISNLPYGEYIMRVSHIGYQTLERTVTVNARNINLSYVFITPTSVEIDEVNITARAVRVSQRGDTISYNAKAFKVSEYADSDELLRQLPGVEVGSDGTVKAQGKDVQKILVDGKETFGTDVATTMRNIPANVIDRVEVYNKLSDFAETTGINDGEDYQVMNFVTGVTFAQIGTFSALYGIKDKYGLDARYNVITGDHGIMLNASANNTGGMGGGGGMMGIGMMGGGGYGSRFGGGRGQSANNKSSSYNTGLNYNFDKTDKFSLNFNYRYGHRDNETKRASDRSYFNTELLGDLYNRATELRTNNSINNDHNFGGNAEWRITPKQRISLRLDGSYSSDNSRSLNETDLFTDVIENRFRYEREKDKTHDESYDIRLGLNYGLRFNKEGRSLSIGLNADTDKEDGNEYIDTHTIIPNLELDSLGRRREINDEDGWRVRGKVQYSEPISRYWNLMAVYEFSYSVSNENDHMEMWDYDYPDESFDTGVFVPWGQKSSVLERRDVSHRVAPGIYYSKNNNLLRLDLVYKYTNQFIDRTLPEPLFKGDISFNNFVYNAMYRMQLTPQKRLEFQLEADTSNPNLNQMQDVDRSGNGDLYVTTGNPGLKPYYTHQGSVSYNTNNIVRATNFSVTVNGSVTMDYIGTRTMIVTEPAGFTTPNETHIHQGGQWSRPENMNESSWSFGADASYSMPVDLIRSNLRLNGRYNYSESPGYINEVKNTARTQGFSFGARVSSNWSTDLVMYLNYSFAPSFTRNTDKTFDRSSRLGHSLGYNVTWQTWKDFVFRGDLSYTNSLTKQKGASDYRFENTMCNVSLGKRIFRNKRGEIAIRVNDLLNQNKYMSQSVYPNYIENVVDKGIGRYFSLSFTYNLRNFSKNGEGAERLNRLSRGRRMR